MRRFRSVVRSVKEPEDHEVLWSNQGSIYYFEKGEWIPIINTQGQLSTSEDLDISEENVISLTDKAKKKEFIDRWNRRCQFGSIKNCFGGYLPEQSPDSEHQFKLNNVWLTYEEAISVDLLSIPYKVVNSQSSIYSGAGSSGYNQYSKCRTYFPIITQSSAVLHDLFSGNNVVESISFVTGLGLYLKDPSLNSAFADCTNLKRILTPIVNPTLSLGTFRNCTSLQDINLKLYINNSTVSLKDSPNLSLDSVNTIISNAQWLSSDSTHTKALDLVIHEQVFSKLTGQMITNATEKNIAITTSL